MKIRFTFALFVFLFLFSVSSSAQIDALPEKQAAIRELMSLINAAGKAEDVVRMMTVQLEAAREETIRKALDDRSDLSPRERKALEEMFSVEQAEATRRFQDKLIQRLDFARTVTEMSAAVYDKYYTLEELRDLIAFYKTPTGQKSLKMTTPIFAETMRLMQERLIPKIPGVIKELQEEDKKEIEQKINQRKPRMMRGES